MLASSGRVVALYATNDLLFKPKPKYVPATTGKKHHHNAGKTLVPWSEFGRKYLEHYRISVQLEINNNTPEKEKSIKRLVRFLGRKKIPKTKKLQIYCTICYI